MTDSALKTLFHPFRAGDIAPPTGGRVLFLNAMPGYSRPDGFGGVDIACVQEMRPFFLDLERAGHRVLPEPEGGDHEMTLVLCGRHRGQNERWIAEALRRTRTGGTVVAAGALNEGAASLRKRMAQLAELDGHASKHHGVVFWLRRKADAPALADALDAANPMAEPADGFVAGPGMFSHDRVDAGSLLLAGTFAGKLKGAAADFGAGWGYLSVRLAQAAPELTSIDLFEAGYPACEAARCNMSALAPSVEARVFWHDLLREPVERRYDVVVMNPPFHQGRAAEPSIGEAMIRVSAVALKPGGRLLMVANVGLPYEPILLEAFARSGETCRERGFKVLWAAR
jgi:16S rRNA (guanine1207-N2)-methyltransferase